MQGGERVGEGAGLHITGSWVRCGQALCDTTHHTHRSPEKVARETLKRLEHVPPGSMVIVGRENYVIPVFVTVYILLFSKPNRNNVIQRTQNIYGMNKERKKIKKKNNQI